MAKALSLDELKHLKLNVSGLILEKKEEIDIEERLQLICNAI